MTSKAWKKKPVSYPKISVVTISLNQGRFLDTAIRSVLEQDYPNLEYIVVDPGSTDGSREIIQRFGSSIDKVILEPDSGSADGLNKGFAAATGDVYGFLNSDDVLEPGALSAVARYFQTHPGIDIVSGHSYIVDAWGRHRRRFYSDRYTKWMAVYQAAILSQPSTFIRANAFQKVGGFNVGNRIAWDGELFLDMASIGAKFARVNEFWSKFRVHPNGITGSGKMHEAFEEYRRYIFKRAKGREPHAGDRIVTTAVRYLRKLMNPLDTFERLLHGPIYKSGLDS